MPICPQITNTSIPYSTWYTANSSNFTVDSTAQSQENATTFYAASAPAAQAIGDTWFDTSNGNKQYRWDGSSWVAVQDAGISTAVSTANSALSSANGKNKVFYQTTAPTATSTGDLWFDTSSTNRPNQWNGSSWVPFGLGYLAVTSIDANAITVNKIQASQITSGIFVSTGGAASDINSNSTTINGGKITTGTITASQVASGTFISTGGAAGDINSGTTTISGGKITANTITVDKLTAGTLTGFTIQTSSGSTAVTLDGSNNAISFKVGGSNVAHIVPLSSYGVIMHYGSSPDGSGGTRPQLYVGSSNVSLSADTSNLIATSTTGNTIYGATTFNSTMQTASININSGTTVLYNAGTIYANSLGTTGSGLPVYQVQSGGNAGYLKVYTSARRFKTNIKSIDYTGYSKIIDDLTPVTFDEIDEPTNINIPGLIAEDLLEIPGVKNLVVFNSDGETMGINYEKLSVMLILALKELKKDINTRLVQLENK